MAEVNDWNRQIIEEFRTNGGKVGGRFEGAPLLLLHSTGAKSGQERINPMMYLADGGSYVVFASKAGAPTNPDWYHNVVAHPAVSIELGDGTISAVARVADGETRERLWSQQKQLYPGFADYESKTTRQIPVVILEPTEA
jgi:deazaflavin-dependent oxidoreductase (nitroreductase family)